MKTKQSLHQSVLSVGLFGTSFIPSHGSDDEAPWQADERWAREEAARRDAADANEQEAAPMRRQSMSRPRVWIARGAAAAFAVTFMVYTLLLRH